MIGSDCEIGLGSEVNRSYIGRGARLHSSKALDSILADSDQGQHVNLAAGSITANLRGDEGTIELNIKGSRVSTGRNKFGAVIGAGTFIGIQAALMPGVRIGEGCVIGPSTIVDADVPDRHRCFVQQQTVLKAMREEQNRDA
jgi:UDP-N-acetylglucosamine diphosphorylase / glucose-1-phosphate thymidylyltransferase / UDP-N-acetylgalactosamine diphosphorylase / glucosamine-1-phosphate N-acetyltransferase / galactosamine-1-phosphate N-acetyltransferase